MDSTAGRVLQDDARDLLRECIGDDATFRPHQWEAIDKLVNNRERLLIVQRTGWGKSTVYFIATRLLRDRGEGPTLIISPLLSLMRNQIQNAEDELGLDAATIHSNNEDEWDDIIDAVTNGTTDLLLISPERLSNPAFRDDVLDEMLQDFGMLVVDEAHCVSDWGHDFRPAYREIKPLVNELPVDTPIAATTATANERVVQDVTTQLPDLDPLRGKLVRDSLHIQTIKLDKKEDRLAWLVENFPDTHRSGIVYCLTTRDVEIVTDWLNDNDINAAAYHGSMDTERREEIEQQLMNNELDAAVATNALGMGFNKPDLEFVIHFQRPPNLIRYYQEIGRAGRDLDDAYAILLAGEEDDDIADHFIETAFPEKYEFELVLEALEEADEPLSRIDVMKRKDIAWGTSEQCLSMLEVDGAIEKTDNGYVRTEVEWQYNGEKIESVTEQRRAELERIQAFVEADSCLTQFIDNELDGQLTRDCGYCASCAGDFFPTTVENDATIEAAKDHYDKHAGSEISPRKVIHQREGTYTRIPEENRVETGYALTFWGEPGLGTRVQNGKEDVGMFGVELVEDSETYIEDEWEMNPEPEWVAAIPSTSQPGLVTGFASMLAKRLDLPFVDAVSSNGERPSQREFENSYQQCWNVQDAFTVDGDIPDGPVLLVDDVVASRWTLTEVGRTLREEGSGPVYPFTLAELR